MKLLGMNAAVLTFLAWASLGCAGTTGSCHVEFTADGEQTLVCDLETDHVGPHAVTETANEFDKLLD